jgi:beta-lactam-binding protein with PASTA domain
VAVAFVIGSTTLWVNTRSAPAATKLQTFAPTSQLFTVPDLQGTNAFAAVVVLQGVHLNFKVTTQVSRTGVVGTVISQTPAAGTKVPGGTVVQMVVRTKPKVAKTTPTG